MTFPVTDANNATQQLLTGAELTTLFTNLRASVDALAPLVDGLEGYTDGIETGLTAVVAAVNAPSGTQPLPTGAATSAKQDTAITALQNSAPADDLFAITPSDTVALATVPKALLVTVAGNVAVRGTGSSPVTLAVTAGQILPIRARYVYATNTTATVVGLV